MTDEPRTHSEDLLAPDPGELVFSHEAGAGSVAGVPATGTRSSPGATGGSAGGATGGSAGDAAREAKAGVADVAQEAKAQVAEVAHTATDHLQATLGDMRGDLRQQASQQTDRAGAGLRRLSEQLQALTRGDVDQAGPVADYARQLEGRVRHMAERVEHQGFDGVVSDLRSFARRRPGAFLAGAAAAGFMAGRMLRSSTGAGSQQSNGSNGSSGYGRPPGGYRMADVDHVDPVPAAGVPASRAVPSSVPPVPPTPGAVDTATGLPGSGVGGIDRPGDLGPQRGL